MFRSKLICVSMLLSSLGFATGFERNLMWSGKWAALGGASNAAVTGAQAVAFNPAGIGKGMGGFALNLSPILSSSEGPVLPQTANDGVPGAVSDGESVFDPTFAILFGKQVKENLGIGFGVYQQGTLKTEYAGVNASNVAGFTGSSVASVGVNFNVTEVAAGMSYAVGENWSLGAAARMSIARGDIDQYFLQTGANNALNYEFSGLQDESIGFRLGLQYNSPDDQWGMGLTYRSGVSFDLEGTSSGNRITGGTPAVINGGAVTVTSELPDQYSFGLYFKSSEMDTIYLEGNYTTYANLDRLDVTGFYNTTTAFNDITLNWEDMYSLRVGFEHNMGQTQYRFGYAFGSTVTSDSAANAAFAPPAISHSLAGGIGFQVNKKLTVDAAVDYTFSSGTGSTFNDGNVIGNNSGEFSMSSLGAHGTLSYAF